jgi:hypothetical protein
MAIRDRDGGVVERRADVGDALSLDDPLCFFSSWHIQSVILSEAKDLA